jgi:hypothetical protein
LTGIRRGSMGLCWRRNDDTILAGCQHITPRASPMYGDFFYFILRKNKNGLIYAEFFCKKICKYMQVFYTFVNRNNQLHLL